MTIDVPYNKFMKKVGTERKAQLVQDASTEKEDLLKVSGVIRGKAPEMGSENIKGIHKIKIIMIHI